MSFFRPACASTFVLSLMFAAGGSLAQTAAPAKAAATPSAKTTPKPAAKTPPKAPAKTPRAAKSKTPPPPPPPVALVLPAAEPEQVVAAEKVYYGVYDCEFKQTIHIGSSEKNFAYVDVKHGKSDYVMKPVLSSTGAIRLEDVRGETLMVQISSKSMLLNVKTAQRIVDECVSPKQRELMEAARAAKAAEAAEAAAAAASGASAPADAKPAPEPLLKTKS